MKAPLSVRQWGFRSWYLIGDTYVCVPPKCGSTSFMRAVDAEARDGLDFRARMKEKKRGPWAPQDVVRRKHGRRVLAVRDPVSRFRSLWRHLVRNDETRLWWADRHRIPMGITSPDELLSFIKRFPMGNYHWYPQYGYVVPGVEIVRYDRLLSGLNLPEVVANVGSPSDMDDQIPEVEVMSFYSMDQALWESVSD